MEEKGAKTKDGRFIHGEKGQGRFKAFSLGETVTWISSANGKRFSITGQISNLKTFKVSDVFPTASKGCTVEISDVRKDFQIRGDDGFGRLSEVGFFLGRSNSNAANLLRAMLNFLVPILLFSPA